MKALVLCGGLGTRLRSVISDLPKPMAPINGKPFLDYVLGWLKSNGIENVILLTGYKGEYIEENVKKNDFGLNVECSKEAEPLGTAGAIKYASKNHELGENFLLINGDTYFDVELKSMIDFHTAKNSVATIALRVTDNTSRYGTVSVDDNYKITEFVEKNDSKDPGFMNGGIYILNKRILDIIPEGKPTSIEKDIFPKLVENGSVYGYPDGGHFIDIGVPEDYERAQTLLPVWVTSKKRPSVFLDRDGVLIEDTGYVHSKDDMKFLPGAIEALKKINESGKLCVVVSNQAGVAHGYYSEEDVMNFEKYMEQSLKKHDVRLDGFYYCPYHPEGEIERYRRDSIYRKPNPGMVLKAVEDMNISLTGSIMIGDKKSDRIKLPQLKSYIVKSKYVDKWDFESVSNVFNGRGV